MDGLFNAAGVAASAVRGQSDWQPRVGLVLGSGLGQLAEQVTGATIVPYGSIPGLPTPSVTSHAGRLVLGELEGQSVAICQGRVHLYEGHAATTVVLPVALLWKLGIERIVLTNAAGGITADFAEGALMLIADHINMTGQNPLTGVEDRRLGQRFLDMTDAYDPQWRAAARRVATELGIDLREGVYLGLPGPSFETPAEIRMAARLGADAVGMSTVLETIMARALGLRVLGLSCITNLAAGLGGPISHEEVGTVAARVSDSFIALVRGILRAIDDPT